MISVSNTFSRWHTGSRKQGCAHVRAVALLVTAQVIFLCALSGGARAWAEQPDPKSILQKSADACRKIMAIEYRVEFDVGGNSSGDKMSATVLQARAGVPDTGFAPGKYRAEAIVSHAGEKPETFAFSYDGAAFRLVDDAEKVIKVIKSPQAYVVGQMLGPAGIGFLGFPPFTHNEPFKEVIEKSDRITYEGTADVVGVKCHIIAVAQTINHPATGPKSFNSRWYIGIEDLLPRRFDAGVTKKIVSITKVNPAIDELSFAAPSPKGYAEKLVTGHEAKTRGLLAAGTAAPDWTLADSGGRTHRLSDYRGKIVLMDFWGTWCLPCHKTMPDIQSLHEKFKGRDVAVFGIAVADNEGDPVGFMKRHGYNYGLLLKGDEVAAAYKAEALPTLYVIGPDGTILHSESGYREKAKAELIAIIEKHLRK